MCETGPPLMGCASAGLQLVQQPMRPCLIHLQQFVIVGVKPTCPLEQGGFI